MVYNGVLQSTVNVASEIMYEPVKPVRESKEMKGAECGALKEPSCHVPEQTEKPQCTSVRMTCVLAETQHTSWDLNVCLHYFYPILKLLLAHRPRLL